ncbi:dynamin family protein [Kitasatospora nipponensis]|uniref:Dynamin family protein n=1 Tax=Kitasatospora nipponensis TaxID=258049 RepID=A0ABN1W837_9ACTN
MTSPHSTVPLNEQVLGFAARAAELLAGAASPQDDTTSPRLAEAIRAEAARTAGGAACLVVVGEKKRGKSSLINSLVRSWELLPVDADVSTGVHVTVRHGDRPRATAFLLPAAPLDGTAPQATPAGPTPADGVGPDGLRPEPIELDQLARFAAVDPVTGRTERADVHHVEVALPAPLFATGLELVDTPGVGGLVSGHAHLALAALEQADALVFVVDGSSELTRSELEFLAQATERTAETVFVLTKTDSHDAWPTVLERNRELLAQHAPRHSAAPWFPVSNRARRDAEAAAEAGPAAEAALLLEDSGFEALEKVLAERIAARAGELRLANLVHVTLSALAAPLAGQKRRLRSLQQDPFLAAEVQRTEQSLRALQSEGAQWRRLLSIGARDLKNALQLDFRRNLNDLRQLAERQIATTGPAALAQEFPAELEAQVEAVWLEVDATTRRGLTALVEAVRRECAEVLAHDLAPGPVPEDDTPLLRAQRDAGPVEMVRSTHQEGGPLGLLENLVPSLSTAGLAAGVVAMMTSSVLLPMAAGYAMLAVMTRRRRQRAELGRARGDATRHLNRVLAELGTEIPSQITIRVDELVDGLTDALDQGLLTQRGRLESELTDYRRNLAASAAELEVAREHTRRRVETLQRLRAEGLALTRALGFPLVDDGTARQPADSVAAAG